MSGSHFIVYGARHGAKSFFEGISDPTFFMSINRILDEGFYREYFDPRLEKTFSFPGLLEFVTDREGLDIADWVPFMKALRAQDDGTAPKVLYWRMVRLDERLDPLIGSAPILNRQGEKGKDYHDNVCQQGTSKEYVVCRLKRDAPELAAALARGEFPSARCWHCSRIHQAFSPIAPAQGARANGSKATKQERQRMVLAAPRRAISAGF